MQQSLPPKVQNALIIFLLFWTCWINAAATPCREAAEAFAAAHASPVQGTEVPVKELSELFPEARFMRLGSGIKGGTVYRVFPHDNQRPFVVKVYRNLNFLRNDLAAQEIYQKAFAGKQTFETVSLKQLSGLIVKVDDIEGVTLLSLLENFELQRSIREGLRLQYTNLLSQAKTALDDWFKEAKVRPDYQRGAVEIFTTDENETRLSGDVWIDDNRIKLLIKPDNIIVTPDGRMVIIDPF